MGVLTERVGPEDRPFYRPRTFQKSDIDDETLAQVRLRQKGGGEKGRQGGGGVSLLRIVVAGWPLVCESEVLTLAMSWGLPLSKHIGGLGLVVRRCWKRRGCGTRRRSRRDLRRRLKAAEWRRRPIPWRSPSTTMWTAPSRRLRCVTPSPVPWQPFGRVFLCLSAAVAAALRARLLVHDAGGEQPNSSDDPPPLVGIRIRWWWRGCWGRRQWECRWRQRRQRRQHRRVTGSHPDSDRRSSRRHRGRPG